MVEPGQSFVKFQGKLNRVDTTWGESLPRNDFVSGLYLVTRGFSLDNSTPVVKNEG